MTTGPQGETNNPIDRSRPQAIGGAFAPRCVGQIALWQFFPAIRHYVPHPTERLRIGCRSLLIWISFLCGPTQADTIIYVDQAAVGANNGGSWIDAFTDLQSALDVADAANGAITEIHIAQGTYRPTKRTNADDPRSAAFELVNNVALRGGFAGNTEFDPDERDWQAFPTIFSGDLLENDGPGFARYDDNAYHVVTAEDVETTTLVEGLTITAGNANLSPYDDYGGGMFVRDSGITLRHCTFLQNVAGELPTASVIDGDGTTAHAPTGGAGLAIDADFYVLIEECRFIENVTDGNGGGLYANAGDYVSIELSGCQFDRNDGGGAVLWASSGTASIRNCEFNGNTGSYGGGAAIAATSTRINDSIFRNNSAAVYGGGLYLFQGIGAQIRDSLFDSNAAQYAGGGAHLEVAGATILERVRFEQNDAVYGKGGGLVLSRSYRAGSLVSECSFTSNNADTNGGAIYTKGNYTIVQSYFAVNTASQGGAVYRAGDQLEVLDTTFENNQGVVGGAIVLSGYGSSRLNRCRFTSNDAAVGGAVFNHGAAQQYDEFTDVSHCLFSYNTAIQGGAYSQTGGLARIQHCTVTANRAEGLGGGLILSGESVIGNTIVWNNRTGTGPVPLTDESAQIEGIRFAEITHSLIQGWTGEYGDNSNFDGDPRFVDRLGPDGNQDTGDENFRLLLDSPAIDAGDPDFVAAPGEGDLDGHARVLCGRVDIGAYEFGIGDFDCDGTIDPTDFAAWPDCMTGPSGGSLLGCEAFDFNADGRVDLADFAGFQRE